MVMDKMVTVKRNPNDKNDFVVAVDGQETRPSPAGDDILIDDRSGKSNFTVKFSSRIDKPCCFNVTTEIDGIKMDIVANREAAIKKAVAILAFSTFSLMISETIPQTLVDC